MRALTDIRFFGPDKEEEGNDGLEVVFEIESNPNSRELVTTTNNQQPLLPNLQHLHLDYLKSMSHVWKCNNWNKFLSLEKQSSFQNLSTIYILKCHRIKYLFSPLMVKLLYNIKTIDIWYCDGIEEVVSNRDDKDEETTTSITHTTTTFFPHLQSLEFGWLENLKLIGGGDDGVHDEFKSSQAGVLSWSLCQYSREICIRNCESLMEVFETQGMNNDNNGGGSSPDIDDGNGVIDTTELTIPRPDNINVPQLSNLKKLEIIFCNLLKHVFTFSSLESLTQLEELKIMECEAMKVIVKKENGEQKDVVVFPRVKCIELSDLPNLNGFFLGMNEFQWPLLEEVTLKECPQMMVFTSGRSTTPKLKYMHMRLGKHCLECGLNFHVATDFHETQLPSSESTSLGSTTFQPCSFHNLIELHLWDEDVKCIIPSNELLQLQKLERMRVFDCRYVEEVFEVEAMEGRNSSESQTVVQIPKLTQVELEYLSSLKYLWKSNHHERTPLLFPNLTTLSIHQCIKLEHVFTSSMVGSLQQLQHLHISRCENLKVIVKEEEEEELQECDGKVKEIEMLPCLKSLKLEKLKSLKGFCLGKDDISWPSLHTLEIMECPEITVFSKGDVATPALNTIDTSFGRCNITEEDINSFIKTKRHQGFSF
ncbi:hypothetical protein L1987_39745 [Smallanthus sonchifolius]|uniref:Uncharacterized protein n=1 Tax=Smallanthus sonchifolius TaxID=185202 RepID=A0ACB9HMV2_9ASTR|nr:hypothetical protein L1987_39745 [Smallanthus sonchifolius]